MRDADVRSAVRTALRDEHTACSDTRIVEEMGIWSGSVRIDVAVINGELAGYELKSARDTLARLPQQAELYGAVFDRVTVVTASNHLEGCLARLPEWWGVLVAEQQTEGGLKLSSFRRTLVNPSLVPHQIARLLWKPEAISILEARGLARGYKSKPLDEVTRHLSEQLALDELRDEVRRALKARVNWLG